MFVSILIVLIFVSPFACLLALIFGSIYLLLVKFTRKTKNKNSKVIATQSTQIIKSLQEGLGGIRDVLIDGAQKIYCQIYKEADKPLRRAQASNQIAGQSPRYIMEPLGMVLIAGIAFYLFSQPNSDQNAIPMLGVLALGAQRMLPVMQQAYAAWSSIQGSHASLEDVLVLLNQPLPLDHEKLASKEVIFNYKINFQDITFRYEPQRSDVIQGVNFSIVKGDRLGIIGATGSGKSTLIDILMGLLRPTSGNLLIDGVNIYEENTRSWQKNIAHVPQAIFLSDTTIAENIAFGIDKHEIDFDRVRKSAIKAQLHSVINNLPDGYNTLVGERGILLSGGQRQRIGIARALYKKADVFIFDEATSALDGKTEDSVMQSITALGDEITVVMIAHRLTTLKNCRKIIELANGRILHIGTYDQIINRSE
jgi:ATP-binding cassette subfamily B protein